MSFTTRRIREEAPRRAIKWQPILLAVLTFGRPVFGWYTAWKKRQDDQKRVALLQRIMLILLAVFFIFLLFAGIAKALIALRVVSVPGVLGVAGADLPTDEDGLTNFLLLGQGDETHDGKDLTDTIMIMSIDATRTKSAVLLSLPRDLYLLHTENMGAGRVNSLYRDYKSYLKFEKDMEEKEASLEAMRELAKELSLALDLPLHHVVKVDFIGFVEAVDAIGGVDLEVPYDIVDTEYPGPNYTYETFEIRTGLQHLDGETALKYARSRHTSSDFDRSARQQQILSVLGEKVKSEGVLRNPGRIMSLYKIVSAHLETTMSVREMVGAAKLGADIDRNRIISMQLSDRNGLYGTLAEPGGFLYTPPRDLFEGASVLLPISIPEYPVTWKQIHTLSDLLFRNRAIHISKPRINVLNAGAKSGLAGKLGGELFRYGFSVDEIKNAGIEKIEETYIAPASDAQKNAATFFSELLDIPLGTLPTDLPSENIADITIIVGQQYGFTPLQDLLK